MLYLPLVLLWVRIRSLAFTTLCYSSLPCDVGVYASCLVSSAIFVGVRWFLQFLPFHLFSRLQYWAMNVPNVTGRLWSIRILSVAAIMDDVLHSICVSPAFYMICFTLYWAAIGTSLLSVLSTDGLVLWFARNLLSRILVFVAHHKRQALPHLLRRFCGCHFVQNNCIRRCRFDFEGIEFSRYQYCKQCAYQTAFSRHMPKRTSKNTCSPCWNIEICQAGLLMMHLLPVLPVTSFNSTLLQKKYNWWKKGLQKDSGFSDSSMS